MRMLMNNLDPEIAEHPDRLIVYGGSGRAARSWDAYHAIVAMVGFLDRGKVQFQGLPARICWLGYGERHLAGLRFNELVARGYPASERMADAHGLRVPIPPAPAP